MKNNCVVVDYMMVPIKMNIVTNCQRTFCPFLSRHVVNDVVEKEAAGIDVICRETGELEVISEATRREDEDPLVEYVASLVVKENQKGGEHQPDAFHLDDEGAVGRPGQDKELNESVFHTEKGTVKQVLEDSSRSSSSSIAMLIPVGNNEENQNYKLVEENNGAVGQLENSGSINNQVNNCDEAIPIDTLQDHGNQVTGCIGGTVSLEGDCSVSGGECQTLPHVSVESSSEAATSGKLSSDIDEESRIVAQILTELGIMIA